jgi:hypothetical protein
LGLEGGSALRRIVLLFVVVALVAAMVLLNAVSGFAEEGWPPYEFPFDDGTDEPSFHDDYPPSFYEDYPPSSYDDEPPFYDDTEDEPVVEDVPEQTVPLCAPGWLQEWYPDWASGWWYFWWYQYCYTDEDGWYRTYDGWDWGYPMY